MRRSHRIATAALGLALVVASGASAQLLGGGGGLGGGLSGGLGGLTGSAMGQASGSGAVGLPDVDSRATGAASQARDRAATARRRAVDNAQAKTAAARATGDAAARQAQAVESQGRAAGDIAAVQGLNAAQGATTPPPVAAPGGPSGVSLSGSASASGSADGTVARPR